MASIGEGGVTLTPPDDSPDRPIVPSEYYSFRLTVPHVDIGKVQDILHKHTKNYCLAMHNADDEVQHEHFHMCILDFTPNKADALKRALRDAYKRSGNGFYAGNFRTNGVFSFITYCKHDPEVDWKHRGSDWVDWIDRAPEYSHKKSEDKVVEKKRKESDPILTFSNLLWRAQKHRKDNHIESVDLGVILEHMTRTTNWLPAPHIMKNGLDPLHFKIFEYRCRGRNGKTPDWWTPKHEARNGCERGYLRACFGGDQDASV